MSFFSSWVDSFTLFCLCFSIQQMEIAKLAKLPGNHTRKRAHSTGMFPMRHVASSLTPPAGEPQAFIIPNRCWRKCRGRNRVYCPLLRSTKHCVSAGGNVEDQGGKNTQTNKEKDRLNKGKKKQSCIVQFSTKALIVCSFTVKQDCLLQIIDLALIAHNKHKVYNHCSQYPLAQHIARQ